MSLAKEFARPFSHRDCKRQDAEHRKLRTYARPVEAQESNLSRFCSGHGRSMVGRKRRCCMKQCVKFPEDKFLAVRTCLVAICMGNRPAANLLSILLFRYNLRMENKDDAENQNAVKASKGESPDQDTSVRIFRTQAQLVEDMCGEITEKTLHDTAVPMLQLLGFLDLEEHMIANCYILHVELVQQALSLYIPGKKEQPQLENFLIEHMQLEKFLITSDELENFLINRKIFQSGLEKVLIQNRKFSNQQRGRRLSADVPLRGKRRLPKKREEDNKKNVE